MSTLITGSSDVSPAAQEWYDRNLLVRALPAEIHNRFLQIRPLPANMGTKIVFLRLASLAVATTPLTEGVTPTGKKAALSHIYATVKQYGDFLTTSDWAETTGLSPVLIELGEILGEQMGLTDDTLARDVLAAGTSVRYANAVANRAAVNKTVAAIDAKSAVRILEGNNTRKLTKMIVAGERVGTRPVAPAYYAITHTDCRQDWEAVAGFNKIEEYASQKNVMDEEIGSYGNLRVLCSTNAKVFKAAGVAVGATGLVAEDSTNVDVYTTLVMGANAAGTIPLQKGNIKNIIKKMGSAGTEDALDQRATSGWKMAKTTKILNDDFMIRIEHGVSELE